MQTARRARTAVPAGHGDHPLHANAARIEAVIVYPSTSIRKTEYDPETRVLSVWFVASGRRYDYEAVPPETYAAFRNAFVKGRFFRDRFGHRLMPKHSDRCLHAETHAPVSEFDAPAGFDSGEPLWRRKIDS
ncbi:MAG: KTSC domain-containing protein, partial [Mesorhizobium sp.]